MSTKTKEKTAARVSKFNFGMLEIMKFSDGSGTGYGGEVVIPHLLPRTRIRLVENTDKQKETSPDYWVESPAYDETEKASYWARAGAAWEKVAKTDGSKFLSVSVDIASQAAAVNMAAFPADDEDQPKAWAPGEKAVVWRMAYSRPRRNAAPKAAASSANPLPGDEIPY